jgi:diphosphomevalonate decarboxylase
MEGAALRVVTARAPINMAVIKYWGKRDEELILPLNSSLSTTLSMRALATTTSVALIPLSSHEPKPPHRLWLNGKEEQLSARLRRCLSQLLRRSSVLPQTLATASDEKLLQDLPYRFHICSENNFPTAAGLASSASGFACLIFALAKLLGVEGELSALARLGSGSACRSMYGGFVKWNKGLRPDGLDSVALQVATEHHWPDLQILVCVVSVKQKETSSTHGMHVSVQTSALLAYRAEHIVEGRIAQMEAAIRDRDFHRFALITMQDSNQFHATCLDTYPPIFYMNDISKSIVQLITQYNSLFPQLKAAYTFDAGPNAVIYCLKKDLREVVSLLVHYYPPSCSVEEFISPWSSAFDECEQSVVATGSGLQADPGLISKIRHMPNPGALNQLLHATVGGGPELVEDDSARLLDPMGRPLRLTATN